MCLTGERVSHARFGRGQIMGRENGYVRVRFDAPYGEKLFVYPDSFADFLTMDSVEKEEEVQRALDEKRRQEAEERARRQAMLTEMREKISAEKTAGRTAKRKK